jgi:hypothetical protein
MRSPLVGLVVSALVLPAAAKAQRDQEPIKGRWAVSMTLGASTFTGATEGTGPVGEPLAFAPYRPTMWGVAVAYGREGLRTELSLEQGQPGIGFRGVPLTESGETLSGLLIVAEDAFKLTTLTASLSQRLLRLRGGPSLRPSFGLVIERWSAPGSPSRAIAGAQAGLALEVMLGRSLAADLSGELGFTPGSPFQEAELPEGFHPRSTWRRTLQVGLAWRFGKGVRGER